MYRVWQQISSMNFLVAPFNLSTSLGRFSSLTYFECDAGKGRDMGFVSINGFEIKISGGNGEVCISRDLYRLATRTDFFRMMSIYYSGPGFFINNAILMMTVYLQTWLLAVLALAGAYLVPGDPRDDGLLPSPSPSPEVVEEDGPGRRLMDSGMYNIQMYHSELIDTKYLPWHSKNIKS